MVIYFKDVDIIAVFEDAELINENNFKTPIANLKIAVRIRDFQEGKSGNNTKHKYRPSVKIISYGKGSGKNHSQEGDPIYFKLMDNNRVEFNYDKKEFKDKKELNYVKNFIYHNYHHLWNYWFAPDTLDGNKLKDYQNRLKDRINNNLSKNDYKDKKEDIDNEIEV